VPPYYVTVNGETDSQPAPAVVRATATGAVLATVTPPRPYTTFTWVTAAADDRTFVLAAQPLPQGPAEGKADPTKFFLLCLNAAGYPVAAPAALPIPAEPTGTDVSGIALSPDASRLAVVLRPGAQGSEIVVYTMATGSATEWQWPGSGWVGNWKPYGSPLSWTADGQTLAFQAWTGDGNFSTTEIRLLDTAAPAGILASSTLVVEWPEGILALGTNTIITPDGTKIACVTGANSRGLGGVATEYSVSTGKIVGILGEEPGGSSAGNTMSVATTVPDVLWSSTTGSTLIVTTSTGAGVLTADQFTPIPWSEPVTAMAAW
jgi:hypothetical protein